MDELSVIVKAIGELSVGAKASFITWIICKYLSGIVTTIIVITPIYKIIMKLIKVISFSESIRKAAGYTEDLTRLDKEKMIKYISENKDSL